MSIREVTRKVGRLPDSPVEAHTEAFVLWAKQSQTIEEWAEQLGLRSKSEALRVIIEAAQPPTSPAAKAALKRLMVARETIKQQSRQQRPLDKVLDERRARKAAAARLRRARQKAEGGGT